MVLYDDKKWLCRLIRTSFTLEDDSGICENVLKLRPYLGNDSNKDDSDSFSSDDSFDVREGNDGGHRKRSNTAIKIDRLEKHRRAHIETQHIRINPSDAGKNEIGFSKDEEYTERVEMQKNKVVSIKKLLDSVPHPSKVPFANYARYEASCQPTAASKRISIFIPFLPPKHRAYPVRIVILASAKIIDLIGLTLWVTSQNHPGIELFSAHNYNLLISDEDGEWDSDFPPLDNKEHVSKFSFSHLALIRSEHTTEELPPPPKFGLSFLLPSGSTFQMILDDPEMTLGEIINLTLTKSVWNANVAPASAGYHLEKLGDPDTSYTDMNMTLEQCKCKEFCLVRDGAKSVQDVARKQDFIYGKPPIAETNSRTGHYSVIVSTGRFNKMKNAVCVISNQDTLALEFNRKTKSYPLRSITGVKLDANKMRVVVTINQNSAGGVASHYLSSTHSLTLTTNELSVASMLYRHLNSIILNYPK